LRATDGSLVWKRRLGAAVETESSPAVAGGVALVGTSAGSRAGERAGLWALSVRDGSVVWRFDPEAGRRPAGCVDVQTSPTVDLARGAVYVGTAGCARSRGFGRFTEAIVGLDLNTGRVRWSHQPDSTTGRGLAFTGKPTLVRRSDGSALVGLGSRDGRYYAVDARNGRLVWRQVVADAGPRGGALGGLVAPAAADDRRLYLTSAAGRGPYLTALDAASGRVLWRNRDVGPSFAPPVSLGRVIVAADAGGTLRGVDARTGRTLWLRAARGPFTAAVAVAGRWLVAGTGFQIPGAAQRDPANGIVAYRLR
jgi:outer membrane protein assembly factor BamB